jgi:UDP-N-acetyl-D-glucosamine dehydrogenase
MGLGYVGLPLAMAWARVGFHVTGLEIDPERVDFCNKGISWISDISSDELADLVSKGNLIATTDMELLADLATLKADAEGLLTC